MENELDLSNQDPVQSQLPPSTDGPNTLRPTSDFGLLEEWWDDLTPLRDVLHRLSELWSEVERFALSLLDGWSLILHRLASQGEKVLQDVHWMQQVLERLNSIDKRFTQMATELDGIEQRLCSLEASSTGPPEQAGEVSRPRSQTELGPLIVPLRPDVRELPQTSLTQHPQNTPAETAHAEQIPVDPVLPQQQRVEQLLRQWETLAAQLDELLPQFPQAGNPSDNHA